MSRLTIKLALCFFAFGPISATAADLEILCSGPPKTHVETITSGSLTYTVRMEGRIDGASTRDPLAYWAYDQYWEPNLYVRLENRGTTLVVNPWLRREGSPDLRSTKSIVDFVVAPGMTEAEKARALWEFEIQNRFHATTDDVEVNDVVKRFNCYGYTLCGNESVIMSHLWRTAGLRTRRGFPNGHSTAEVFFDGAFHLLDSDESIICLLRDNRTLASEQQIVEDHDLMKRTHSYGVLHDLDRMRDEGSAALHYWEGERSGEHESQTSHTMDFILRPGEALTWAWNPGGKYHGSSNEYWNKRWRLIAHVMDGKLEYSPDLSLPSIRDYLTIDGAVWRNGSFGPALYAQKDSAWVIVPVSSPYPVVGGRIEVDFSRISLGSDRVRVSLSFDSGATWKEAWTSIHSDYARMYIDLDPFFANTDPARYTYLVRLDLVKKSRGGEVCLKGFLLRSTLQMAQLGLPGLALGTNRFTYTDQSTGPREVRITHLWRECSQAEIPGVSAGALYPPDKGLALGTRFAFRWKPPENGPPPVDYEFQLGEFPDLRWVLSPNFHVLISRTFQRGEAAYELPYLGLLNPDQTYYWRVRARSGQGVWGRWSPAFSFKVVAPAVPVGVSAGFQPENRTAMLTWNPGRGGTSPAYYRIFGSAERGFTASDTAYVRDGGLEGMVSCTANLLFQTDGPVSSWIIPPDLWRPYYRVSAVDSDGRESGPSAQAELPHPLIVATSLPQAVAGKFYQAQVRLSASIGHLVSATENGKAYQMRMRSGDKPAFQLQGAPDKLAIDRKSGLLSGFVEPKSQGSHNLLILVTDSDSGRSDSLRVVLEVKPR